MIHEAVAPEVAVTRVLRALSEKTALSINGKAVPVAIDSICVHSDTPGALPLAKAVYEAVSDHL
jgi:5-oxoprolinase (ATP-hydrolysing) subunit A